jgi:hypothetical protein
VTPGIMIIKGGDLIRRRDLSLLEWSRCQLPKHSLQREIHYLYEVACCLVIVLFFLGSHHFVLIPVSPNFQNTLKRMLFIKTLEEPGEGCSVCFAYWFERDCQFNQWRIFSK